MADTKNLILYIAIPVTCFFILICIFYLLYKFWYSKRTPKEDRQPILQSNGYNDRNSNEINLNNLRITNDVYLIQKVNENKRKQVLESRESAYVYLQFYMRSNPSKIFKSVEHLNNIGSQSEIERNWFLVKQSVKSEKTETNKYRIIFVNTFGRSNPKKTKLLDIADSMSLTYQEMELLLDEFLKSIKHPHVLPFDTVNVNFDKDRILFIQDYSRDGSLRDHLRDVNPYDIWEVKSEKQTKNSLPLKTIKEYSIQILSGLIYLKHNFVLPVDNLHSGNVILAYKKKMCLLTGYENNLFLNKTRADIINDKFLSRVAKTYLIQTMDNQEQMIIRKSKSDLELKRIIEILRFGLLILEMCTGFEQDELIPRQNTIDIVKSLYSQTDSKELVDILNYIFFNRERLDENNEKHKKKFFMPDLQQIYAHKFFSSIKLKDYGSDTNTAKNPKQIELMQYLTGKLEIKLKKLRRKSSLALNNFSRNRLSVIKEPEFEMSTETNMTSSSFSSNKLSTSSSASVSSPPPPPPPPPPPMPTSPTSKTIPVPPPPPPPPTASSGNSIPIEESNDRSALLGDIRKGLKLKKATTVDKSKPKLT